MTRISIVLLSALAVVGCAEDDRADSADASSVGFDAEAVGDARILVDAYVSLPDAASERDADVACRVPADRAGVLCGATECESSEVCVVPCNCGQQQCIPLPDDGCPAGFQIGSCLENEPSCIGCPPPPSPFCAPAPTTCTLECSEFETDPCWDTGGECGGILNNNQVQCVCA